jgi:hypothetical protein
VSQDRRPIGHLAERSLAALVLLWIACRTARLLRSTWAFTTDDAYITLRYARHLAEGHGIVWNVGDHPSVEGYSNFLFVLLGAGAKLLELDPMLVLKGASCAALMATIVFLYLLARRWLTPLGATLAPAALTAFKGTIFWSVSGLETSVYQLWVVGATFFMCKGLDAHGRAARAPFRLCALACLLAALTRPEGPVVALALGATAFATYALAAAREERGSEARARIYGEARQSVVIFLALFVFPYAVYFVWRVAHFGRLLPNTVYCKAAYRGDRWILLREFWDQGRFFILLACAQRPRRLGPRALSLFLIPVAYAVMLTGADPIIGYYSRHFLAAFALLVVAASIGAANLASFASNIIVRLVRVRARLPEAATIEWLPNVTQAVLAGVFLVTSGTLDTEIGDPLAQEAARYSRRMAARKELGGYLDASLSPSQRYVIGDAGIVPYVSRPAVTDAFCLNSRELTSPEIHFDETRFIDWIYRSAPDALVVHSLSSVRLTPRGEYGFFPALVRDARFGQYRLDRVFGARGDDFSYWVYRRNP